MQTKRRPVEHTHLHKYHDITIYYTKLVNWPSLLGIVNQWSHTWWQYEEREEEVSQCHQNECYCSVATLDTHQTIISKTGESDCQHKHSPQSCRSSITNTGVFTFNLWHCSSYVRSGVEESIPIRVHINEKSPNVKLYYEFVWWEARSVYVCIINYSSMIYTLYMICIYKLHVYDII